ncbi:MAG TPA: hypothetical protein VK920_01875 [Solirubrobacterales bacterium]|nr:hypothetical protein [Solirubrobacterales bacterium]
MRRRARTRNPAQRLRTAVAVLPRHTRIAMLRGIDANRIIAGGYSDKRAGGICPMLAAHRNGGRTNLASFARAWDRFTGARRPRLATDRELRALRSYIELSLLEDEQPDSLASLARRIRRERPARKPKRRRRLGAWLIPTRRYDVFTDRVVAAHEQASEQRAARLLTSRRRRAASIPSG